MAVSIDLIREGVEDVDAELLGVFRLRITADNAVGIDANVFVLLRKPASTGGDNTIDKFQNVASVADMAEYPVGEPDEDTEFPFYRAATITLDFRCTRDLEYAWTEIQARVRQLCQATDRLGNLVAQETVNITS